MKVVDFAEKLRDLINEKINKCRNNIHESNNHVDKDMFMIKIQVLEWVQGRTQDIILNNATGIQGIDITAA
jgi:hypothetical protein